MSNEATTLVGGHTKNQFELQQEAILSDRQKRRAVIRTSDRNMFKQCRRKWAWQSASMQNLEPLQQASPLWFGSGIHYALEDYHGFRHYAKPSEAFDDYVQATVVQARQELPDDWKETRDMGVAMLDYYSDQWLIGRDPLQTLVIDGIPQVEVNFIIDLPFDLAARGWDEHYDSVIYSGTIDRVTVDENGFIWLVDYKTAKVMKTSHLANDPQVSAYCWAASKIYNAPVAGLIYWQFLKQEPKPPEPMASGKISTNKQQRTTHRLYRQGLINTYGSVQEAPEANVAFLNSLTVTESEDGDKFIRRDKIYKNEKSHESEGTKIMMELEDILNPNLPLYPNPNWTCASMCSFYEACVSMDDGSDWQAQLEAETQQRHKSNESWRKYLKMEANNPRINAELRKDMGEMDDPYAGKDFE